MNEREPQLDMFTDYGVGGRGGPDPPMTVERATELFVQRRGTEHDQLRDMVLRICWQRGSVHADDLRGLEISSANIIGTVFNTLERARLIKKTTEHRASRAPATHGRRSYVFVLTPRGEQIMSRQF